MLTTMSARQGKSRVGCFYYLFIKVDMLTTTPPRQVKGWLFLLFIYKGWYVNHYVSKASQGLAVSIIYL